MRDRLLNIVKSLAWQAGALRAYRTVVARSALTVFGLHRVLRRDDPRWPGAMPTWTVDIDFFRSAMEFIGARYRPVTAAEVARAIRGAGELPRCAALVTFDDGWADTADTAAPILQRLGIPAVVFVVSGLVGSRRGIWEAEWYAALQGAGAEECNAVARRFLPDVSVDVRSERGVAMLADRLRMLSSAERWTALEEHLGGCVDVGMPQMITAGQFPALLRNGIEVGGHGVTHEPLTVVPDGAGEVAASMRELRSLLRPLGTDVVSFSFPHGRYSAALVSATVAAGAAFCCVSDTALVPAPGGRPMAATMGRVWLGNSLQAADGRFSPALLGWRASRASRTGFVSSEGA